MRARTIIALTVATGTTVAFGSLALAHRESASKLPTPIERLLPPEAITLVAGYASRIPLPKIVRAPLFRMYCNSVGCDLSEISQPLDTFRSLAAFHARILPTSARPMDEYARIVVPADGVVEALGRVAAFGSLPVKGQTVSIHELLAADERDRLADVAVNVTTDGEKVSHFGTDERGLWYVIIRMSARHAHSFSSPCDWAVKRTRRVPGKLGWLSPDAFTQNERLTLAGAWDFGVFCMTAVGATGWGTIVLASRGDEEDLQVGSGSRRSRLSGKVRSFEHSPVREVKKGTPLGSFRMGSAIVLVFEAPSEGFSFYVKEGEEIRSGQPLAYFSSSNSVSSRHPPKSGVPKDDLKLSSRQRFVRSW